MSEWNNSFQKNLLLRARTPDGYYYDLNEPGCYFHWENNLVGKTDPKQLCNYYLITNVGGPTKMYRLLGHNLGLRSENFL